jgi:hypothetical protein
VTCGWMRWERLIPRISRDQGGAAVRWHLLVGGGGPTADRPTVVFRPPPGADQVSHAMTPRAAGRRAADEALRVRVATFLTPAA